MLAGQKGRFVAQITVCHMGCSKNGGILLLKGIAPLNSP